MVDREVNVRLQAHVGQYMASMQQASARTAAMGTQVGRTMQANKQAFTTAGVAAVGFGAAVGAGLASAVSAGAEFESRMNQVRAVSGATAAEFEQLSGIARELGASTKFTATEAAEGLSFLSMAGFEASESIEALPGVLDLAAAGNMDLASAADIASNVLQGFSMEASNISRVNDTMAATFTSANTNMQQLGDAMSYVAPVANSAGIELEETSAAIGLMSDAGIQGTRAGTGLRMALSRLLDETGPAADVLDRLGVSATDSEGNLRDLNEIIRQLEESGASTSDVIELFGMRAGPAMQTLVDRGGDALEDFTKELENSGGTAQRVAETQMEGLQGAVTELGSALEGLKIRVAESGGLTDSLEGLADTTTSVIRAMEGLPEPAVRAATQMATTTSAASLLGGAALIAGPRVAGLSQRLGGLRGASARLGVLSVLTDAVFQLAEGFHRGGVRADEMMQEIIDGSATANEALSKLDTTLRDHLDSMGEFDAGRITNSLLGLPGLARNAGDAIAELRTAWNLWRGEAEVAQGFSEDITAGFRQWADESDRLGLSMFSTGEQIRGTADAADDVDESSRRAAQGLGRTASSMESLTGIGESTFQALAKGFDVFDIYQQKASEIAEATDQSVDDIGASWGRFQESQQETLEDQRDWMANLRELRARGFDALAADLAARGPEQAGLVAEAAEQSNAELEKGQQRALEIRRQKGELALSELQSQLGNMVDVSGALSQEAADAIAEELGVTPGNVRAILENSKTVAEGQLDAIETAFGTGAAEAARAAVDNLNLGGAAQANIVSQYATQLAEGLNPVIEQVNGNPIVVPGKADWRNVPYAAGAAMAAGGMRGPDAHIASSPTVLYGEGPGAEAFIPMYEGQGASKERSRSIWQDVGRHWGFDEEMAAGGLSWPDNIKRDRVVHFANDAPGWGVGQAAAAWDRLNEHLDVLAGSGKNQSLVTTADRPTAEWYGISNGGDRISLNTAKGLDRDERRNTATHEMGHVLGFDHPSAGSIMNPSMALSASGPTGWDAKRLQEMYPPREALPDADGGMTPPRDLPSPEDLPLVPAMEGMGGHLAEATRASMEHTRQLAVEWMEANLAPDLSGAPGWEAMWDVLQQQFPAADLISAFRPGAITATGNPSYHGMGRAVDVSPRMDIFDWLAENYPNSRELIFSPAGGRQIKDGRNLFYGEPTRGDHWDHIHWAMARGGILGGDGASMPAGIFDDGGILPSGSAAVNTSGSPEVVIPQLDFDRIVDAIESLKEGIAPPVSPGRQPTPGGGSEFFNTDDLDAAEDLLRRWQNMRDAAFETLDAQEQIADLERRMANAQPWSDEWVRLREERERIIEDEREAARERQREMRDLIGEQQELERDLRDRRIQFEEDVAQRRRQHQRSVDEEIARRRQELAGQIDVLGNVDRIQQRWEATRNTGMFRPEDVIESVDEQAEMLAQWGEAVGSLREQGLDQRILEELGLARPGEDALRQAEFLLESPKLDQIADAFDRLDEQIGEQVADEAAGDTPLGKSLDKLESTLHQDLGDLRASFREDAQGIREDLGDVVSELKGLRAAVEDRPTRSEVSQMRDGIRSGAPK